MQVALHVSELYHTNLELCGRIVESCRGMWLNAFMEAQDLQDVHHALVQQWGIGALEPGCVARDALIEALGRRVDFLMKHDHERLLYGMYMIDVSEQRFSDAIKLPEKDRPGLVIAELILEREIEKMESRKRFASPEDSDGPLPIEDHPPAS